MTQYMQEAGAMKQADEQREAFEAWADTQSGGRLRSSNSNDYDYPLGRLMWAAWQAALAANEGTLTAGKQGGPTRDCLCPKGMLCRHRTAGVAACPPANEAPLFRCTSCGRKSWDDAERGKFCNLPQPGNRRCSGVMAAVGVTGTLPADVASLCDQLEKARTHGTPSGAAPLMEEAARRLRVAYGVKDDQRG